MPKKFSPSKKHILTAPERYEKLDPQRVMSHLPLLVYQTVADIGCGPGYFTVPLAKYLFDGKVYALDVQQKMVDAARESTKLINLTNVHFERSGENKLPLEEDCLDGALVAFVLHEANRPHIFLKEVKRCLRKGGWLAILEWHKMETVDGPSLEDRIAFAQLTELVQDAGFRQSSRYELNDEQYMLLVRK